jgi:glycine/D-amino acid oxidase-like deaminating enzyme
VTFDTIIVGGGIVGAACARAFARQGMRVALVEPGEIGAEATAAAMGHVVVLDDSPEQLSLSRYSQLLWRQLASELPFDAEYTQRGTLWVAADDEEFEAIGRKYRVFAVQDIPSELLDAKALAQAEPALRAGLAGGLLVPQDAVVSPQHVAQFLLQQAAKLFHVKHRAVTMGAGKVALRNGEEFHAPVLINAAGEWASLLTPNLTIAKRKGHLAMTAPYPGFLRYQVVELGYLKSVQTAVKETVACNVQPRRDGRLLIGSSRQYGAEGREVEDHILNRIYQRAAEYLPRLPSLKIERTWIGFRSVTPDKLPLIGPTSDPTVFLATGHEGLGITTSLATAQLLADLITGKTPAIPIEPYFPNRSALQL